MMVQWKGTKLVWLHKVYINAQVFDYFDIFSHVVCCKTIYLVLNLAISLNWPIRQLDINVFLHGILTKST